MRIKLAISLATIFFTGGINLLNANETIKLEEIKVEEDSIFSLSNENYYQASSFSGTKMDTPIKETAQSIQIITKDTLEDIGAVKMDNVLDYVSGVDRQNNFGGTWDNFSIRGFFGNDNNGMSMLKNGFADNRGYNAPRDSAIIENIEFLKGPSGSLYGNSEPGGTINIVTKQPKFKPQHSVKLTSGSYDFYRTSLDTTALISENIAYRLNVVAEKKGNFREYVESKRYVVAPALTWLLSDNTSISYNADFVRQEQPLDRGIVAINGDLKAIKKDVYIGNPNDGDIVLKNYTNQIKLEHYFNDDWVSRSGIAYKDNSFKGYGSEMIPSTYATTDSVNLRTRYRDYSSDDIQFQSDIKGEFDVGSAKNTLLFGVEAYRIKLDQFLYTNANAVRVDNIYSKPTYTNLVPISSKINTNTHEKQNGTALFVQDELAIGDFRFFAGLRYDKVDMKTVDYKTSKTTKQDDDAILPRVGITYLINQEWSIYTTSGTSFRPNSGLDRNGNSFDPEEGLSFEAGLKYEAEDKRYGATLSAYQITKKNVLTKDLLDDTFNVASGEVESKGIEFDINGKITDNFKLNANYSYINTEITKDNQGLQGKELRNIPKHSATLLAMYEENIFQNSSYGLGGSISYIGSKQGNDTNSFKLPSYTKVGLISYYKYKKDLTFQLNVENVLDKEYIESSYDYSWLNPGNPRSFMLSMNYKF